MGQVPLARLQLTCCARRNHPRQVLELVPAGVVAEAEEPEQEDGVSTTSESTNPGPRLQLWVVPNSRCPNAGILGPTARLGAYFGSEGLEPPERLYHNEIRWYAVWHIPGIGRWRVAGIHWGFDNTAYAAILALHRGIFEGIAFRRCDSREEAAEIFKARAEGFDLEESLSNPIFGWNFTYDLESWQQGFLKLAEGFETPRWREALVVSLENEWLQCLVRCSRAEIEKSELSHIENDEGIFCLVEAPFDKLLGGAPEACKELAADLKELLKSGLTAVHSEGELTFATALD